MIATCLAVVVLLGVLVVAGGGTGSLVRATMHWTGLPHAAGDRFVLVRRAFTIGCRVVDGAVLRSGGHRAGDCTRLRMPALPRLPQVGTHPLTVHSGSASQVSAVSR
ncbi:hypothetical protein AB0M46_21535 [Dactylosporangium sp. NPDC051485]|uniref:hypothetical protein n=1 Tax=Dactylosporangium sp. NPDC051485 TaxID=3154846 RepID=UPI003416392F